MAAPLLRDPETRAQAKLLSFPSPVPQQAPVPAPAVYAVEPLEREPRHSALLLVAVGLIALLLYFSAALV